MSCELYHLGDICTPGLLINDILNQKEKKLFMLGIYEFNNIIDYLNENKLEEIYNREHLILINDREVKHKIYNFIFNHDYLMQNGNIINYEQVSLRFKEKLNNWKKMCESKINTVIFLHFSTNNLSDLRIQDMMISLRNQRPEGPIYLFIFTTEESIIFNVPNVTIVTITGNRIMYPWELSFNDKNNAKKQIYQKFLEALNNNNITHNFN